MRHAHAAGERTPQDRRSLLLSVRRPAAWTPAFPLWSLTLFVIYGLILNGLTAYREYFR